MNDELRKWKLQTCQQELAMGWVLGWDGKWLFGWLNVSHVMCEENRRRKGGDEGAKESP